MQAKERMDLAWDLLRARRFGEALAQYEWLWTNIPTGAPELSAVRVSFIAMYIRQLCDIHAEAKGRFREFRDQAGRAADDDGDLVSPARFDWIVLNEVVGEADAVLPWFDRVQERLHEVAEPVLGKFVQRLAPVLVKHGRWDVVGRLRRDPLGQLRQSHEVHQRAVAGHAKYPPATRAKADADMARLFRQQVCDLHRSLLAAGRTVEAEAVFEEAVRLDDDPDLQVRLAVAAAAVPSRAS